MFNLFKRKLEPKVGMRLECKTWGRDYTEIEIVRVSNDKSEVLYKFITAKGTKIVQLNASTYDTSWKYIFDTYKLIEE